MKQNRELRIGPIKYAQLIFDKVARANEGKIAFLPYGA